MQTQKEIREAGQVELDRKWQEKYPEGQFTIQLFNGTNLFLNVKRRTTRRAFGGGIYFCLPANGRVTEVKEQNNSFGKCTSYDSYEKFLAACQKLNVPTELLTAFKNKYEATR